MTTNFTWIDGSIVGLYLLGTMIAGIMARRYVGKVEHFLVAGREMDLYLGIASLAATEFGITTCMYTAQNGYTGGFAGATPGIIMALAMVLIGFTGFCIKPLRDAGVMTIPELFERRFGARIRWLTGVVIVLGGLLNMGVFLRIGGEFLITVTGISGEGHRLELMMTILLLMVLVYTILGGMLSVLVTDYLQFIVMSAGLLVVTILILVKIGWGDIVAAVETNHGAGGFNPFVNETMGWSYIIFQILFSIAGGLNCQTMIMRVLSARDAATGRKIYTRTSFFFVCRFLIPGLWGMAALAVLAPEAVGDNTLRAMPMLLATILPVGLMGILIAAMLAADMSTCSAYMLTWGSIIYNDLLAPFRRGAWSEKRGLLWNRTIIALIGIFLLFYGLWYPLKGNLWSYLQLTGTIYLSSISVILIGFCYWKPSARLNGANNWGAMAAIIVSAVIPVVYLIVEQIPSTAEAAAKIGPFNSGIITYVATAAAMVIGSLVKPRGSALQD